MEKKISHKSHHFGIFQYALNWNKISIYRFRQRSIVYNKIVLITHCGYTFVTSNTLQTETIIPSPMQCKSMHHLTDDTAAEGWSARCTGFNTVKSNKTKTVQLQSTAFSFAISTTYIRTSTGSVNVMTVILT